MKKTILIVDDEADILRVSSIRLERSGYEVFQAADGPEALELARQAMPDLILLDVLLPTLDGTEVTRTLKRDAALKHIPVILFSAAVEDLAKRALESGADGYLFKPFGTGELLGMIGKHLAAPSH